MALVLDTGGLIAFDRGDRAVAALVAVAVRRGEPAVTSSGAPRWGPRSQELDKALPSLRSAQLAQGLQHDTRPST